MTTDTTTPGEGSRFGHFTLQRLLGEGSHGTVWLARQDEPRREVALKVLAGTLAGGELQGRFRREVELLAMLEHPAIARLYESGVVESAGGATPYLAMEFVDGQALQAWAATSPALQARVELLEALCRAVHFAHTRGVIHRDLKPSNILVDSADQPHIIDFGIASALDRSDLTRMTMVGSVLGTLPYMSPEQLDGSSRVDPRWDVYALGVIAYELLGGSLPHPGLADATSVVAAMKIVATRTPQPLGKLARDTRGDLETVVMKAISHDAGDRYGSAAELADELRRWLQDRPVEAAPPTPWHMLQLFVRRHRALSWAAAAVAVILVVATAVSLRMAVSEAEARRASELRLAERDSVNKFLTGMLLSADPEQGAGSDIRVREWLASTDAGYQLQSRDLPPDVRQSLARTLGTALLHLGDSTLASPRLEEAHALSQRLHGAQAPATLALGVDAARAQIESRPEVAEARLRALLAQAHALGHAQVEVEAGTALVSLMESQGRIDDAFKMSTESLARARAALPADAPATLTAIHNQSAMLKHRGDYAAAEPLARSVYERRKALLGEAHPLTLYSRNQLGGILDRLGKADEAEAIYRAVYAARRASLGDRHPATLVTLNNLSALLIARGKLDDAAPLLDTLVASTRERFGNDGPQSLMAMNLRAYALEDLGRLDEAEAQLRTIVATMQAQGGDMHPERLAPRSNLAMLLSKRGHHAEAASTMQSVVDDAAGALGEDHPYVGVFRSNYGEILTKAGRTGDARIQLGKAQVLLEAKFGADHARTRKNLERMALAGMS